MKNLKFYYNAKTCRYEPYRISVWRMLGFTLCFFIITTALFIGIQFLHYRFFETENARALRLENKALKTHYSNVHNQLDGLEATLLSIKAEEDKLHQTIFNSSLPRAEHGNPILKGSILQADASYFSDVLSTLQEKAKSVALKSEISEIIFSNMGITKNDVPFFASIPSAQPIENSASIKLASGFGERINPYHKGNHFHTGIDFSAPRGTPVKATGNGTVSRVVKTSVLQAGYGNYVEINNGEGFITRFAHLEEVFVRQGQKISKGTTLGTVGATGGAIAPHLHYEVLRNGNPVDPLHHLIEGVSSKQYSSFQKLSAIKNQSLD